MAGLTLLDSLSSLSVLQSIGFLPTHKGKAEVPF